MKMCKKCPDEKYRLSNTELCIECQKDSNLPKAEASHAVLSEVRAIINNMRDNKKLCDRRTEDIVKDAILDNVLQKISEHFR